jgi:hypothetical protein
LEPALVTGDSGYSGLNNLKTVRNHSLGFLFALESHRLVSVDQGSWGQVQQLEIPEEGLEVWLRGFGPVKLLRTRLKDQLRHDAVHLPDGGQLASVDRETFLRLHNQHWQIDICQTQPIKMTGCPLRYCRLPWHDLRGIFKREYLIDGNLVPGADDCWKQTVGACLALCEGKLFQIITPPAAAGCRVFRHLLPVERALLRLP